MRTETVHFLMVDTNHPKLMMSGSHEVLVILWQWFFRKSRYIKDQGLLPRLMILEHQSAYISELKPKIRLSICNVNTDDKT